MVKSSIRKRHSKIKIDKIEEISRIFDPHWNYFVLLENDFVETTKYVEFCKDNYSTYSQKYAQLILSICSEIDVMLKLISTTAFSLQKEEPGIADYYDAIVTKGRSKGIINQQTWLLRDVNIKFKPWNPWRQREGKVHPLSWWDNYNKVKHHRHEHYPKANLKNTIECLNALFCLNLFPESYYNMQRHISTTSFLSSKNVPELVTY